MLKNIFGKNGEKTPENTTTVSLQIEGMTCSGCSTHIEKDLNKTEGVISLSLIHI